MKLNLKKVAATVVLVFLSIFIGNIYLNTDVKSKISYKASIDWVNYNYKVPLKDITLDRWNWSVKSSGTNEYGEFIFLIKEDGKNRTVYVETTCDSGVCKTSQMSSYNE